MKNISCVLCGLLYSPTFKKCVFCCPHGVLSFDEAVSWHAGGWAFTVVCDECGKNFDFSRNKLISNYRIVKK